VAVLEIAKYNQDSLLISQMTRKEVVQSQIDFYNSVLSSVVMGGVDWTYHIICPIFPMFNSCEFFTFFGYGYCGAHEFGIYWICNKFISKQILTGII
jgi:hypothetical protein